MKAWKEANKGEEAEDDEEEEEDKGSPKLDGKKRGRPPAQQPVQQDAPPKDAPKDSPPAKKPKGRGKGSKPEQLQNGSQFDTVVVALAAKLNLEMALMNLAAREEIKAKGIAAAKLLTALQNSNGLVNKAKVALLAGA